jgi:hypothetical protein
VHYVPLRYVPLRYVPLRYVPLRYMRYVPLDKLGKGASLLTYRVASSRG